LANLNEKRFLVPKTPLKIEIFGTQQTLKVLTCLGSGLFGDPPRVFDPASVCQKMALASIIIE
jgi:hypothetical protein